MSEREAGWYWAMVYGEWEPMSWDGKAWKYIGSRQNAITDVAHRIPAPGEPWQCVPAEPTEGMMHSGCAATGDCERLGECHMDCHCSPAPKVYSAMLAAAPKPGSLSQ